MFLTWVTGIQLPEPLSAASDGVQQQEAGIEGKAGTQTQVFNMGCGHPKGQLNY